MKTYKEKISGLSRWPGDSFDDCRAIASGIAEAADAEIAQLKAICKEWLKENAERDALAEQLRISRQSEREAWRYKEDLTAERDAYAQAATEAQAERDAARDERDALLKDAERFQWLREKSNFAKFTAPMVFQTPYPVGDGPHWRDSLTGGELEEAIDAAMASSSKGGK